MKLVVHLKKFRYVFDQVEYQVWLFLGLKNLGFIYLMKIFDKIRVNPLFPANYYLNLNASAKSRFKNQVFDYGVDEIVTLIPLGQCYRIYSGL